MIPHEVYDPNMPDRLPALLFIRRLAVLIFYWKLFALRTIVIATIWLAFLPYTTVWVWRFYFWTGEHMYVGPIPFPLNLFSSS